MIPFNSTYFYLIVCYAYMPEHIYILYAQYKFYIYFIIIIRLDYSLFPFIHAIFPRAEEAY